MLYCGAKIDYFQQSRKEIIENFMRHSLIYSVSK